MSRRAGIRYSESSEDEDYEYSRSKDGQRGYYYSDREEKARHDRDKLARRREMMRPSATSISSVRRPPLTTASREPTRVREPYHNDERSGEDDEVIEANGTTFAFNGNEIRLDRNYVGGSNRPGHSRASKLQQQGPRAFSDVCNKDTISKDKTVGNQAQMDDLLASFGKRALGRHYHQLQKTPGSDLERDWPYQCEYCSKTFDNWEDASRHQKYLAPSDTTRGHCKAEKEYMEEKKSNRQQRQRQQLAQDEYGDEAVRDAELDDDFIIKSDTSESDEAAALERAKEIEKKKRETQREKETRNRRKEWYYRQATMRP